MATVEQRNLGAGGPPVTVIGFGAWPIGGGMGAIGKAEAIATVRSALEAGITMVDTAEAYRTSEAIIGEALRGGYRERCFLATKASSDYSPQGIRSALERSLRALQVDFVDLYQIHGWDSRFPIEASMEAMRELRDEGKTRYVGVSNFLPEHMEKALRVCPIQSNQVRYSLLFRGIEQGTVEYCERHGIGIVVHSPLAKGLLTGRYTRHSTFAADDERSGFPDFQGEAFARHLSTANRLEQVARSHGISMVQLAIAWTLRIPAISCTLVGARDPRQIGDQVGAAAVRLTPAELREIERILSAA
jgi:aryl-alcohol dehydrogenase-like predicted oxidoreductase